MSAQSTVAALYRAVGCSVYITSQNRTSHVSRGLPDMFILHPRFGRCVAHEHKRRGEAITAYQQTFALEWEASGGYYVRGDLDDARQFLVAHGFLIPE